tara:strand:+ start:405 stop:1574 length:1170 start_codon:yes stop_codon:yes gene_type:complete
MDDNHANQLNPNNDAYYQSRGFDGRPDDSKYSDSDYDSDSDDYDSEDYDTYLKNKEKVRIDNLKIIKLNKFILYKFSFSKIKKEIEKNKNVKIKCVFNAYKSFIKIENNNNNIKNLEDCNLLINKELNKLCKQELKYNKIVNKIIKYQDYPYTFFKLDYRRYGDSHESDYLWKNGENIKKYFKYNNLSLLKRNSYKSIHDYEISEYIRKNKFNTNTNTDNLLLTNISTIKYNLLDDSDNISSNKFDFIMVPSEKIINHFVNEIRNNYNKDNILSNFIIFDKLRGDSYHSSNSFWNFIKNIDKDSSEIFINFIYEIFPCLIFYITKNGTLSLINLNNDKIIYEYILPEKYSNNKITNICLLENDNILIELDYIFLLELNIITTDIKSFLY